MSESPSRQPARFLVALAVGSALFGSTAASPLYGLYQARLGFASSTLTALFAAYAVGVLLSLLALGQLADRVRDRRMVLVPGLGVVAVGSLVFALADGLPALFLGRVLAGLGTGALTASCNAALLDLDQGCQRRRAATIGTIAFTAGAALGPIVASTAIRFDIAPTMTPFLINAVMALVAAAGLVKVTWLPRVNGRLADNIQVSFRSSMRTLKPAFVLACAILVVAWTVGSTFVALGPTMATLVLPTNQHAAAGLVVSVFQIAAGFAQFGSQFFVRRTAVRMGCALLVLAWLGSCWALQRDSAWALFLCATGAGVGYGAAFVGCTGKVNEIAPPAYRARLGSIFLLVGYLGSATGVLSLGVLVDRTGLLNALLLMGTLLAAAVIVIEFALIPRRTVAEIEVG